MAIIDRYAYKYRQSNNQFVAYYQIQGKRAHIRNSYRAAVGPLLLLKNRIVSLSDFWAQEVLLSGKARTEINDPGFLPSVH